MNINIYKDAGELFEACAMHIVKLVEDTLKKQGRFSLVLAGGTTPEKLYELLAKENFKSKIDWKKVDIFFGDERFVPRLDKRNNATMAREKLLSYIDISPDKIYAMETEDISPEHAADAYNSLLENYFQVNKSAANDQNTFDLVLLGMGDDGHTLSLFPGNEEAIYTEGKNAISIYLEAQNMHRITLTAEVVNKSKEIIFLVTGPDKAPVLKKVINGQLDPVALPSQIINPIYGHLNWFVDEAAAREFLP